MFNGRSSLVWDIAVHLAVADDVFDDVLFCAVLVLNEI